jgi:hypothetical protein
MNTRTYGILAGVIGSAFGVWWYSRRRAVTHKAGRQRGVVIYDNTPSATALSTEGVV